MYILAHKIPLCLINFQWFKYFLQILFYYTNLIKLDALGILRQSNKFGATKYINQNFSRGSPTELSLLFNSLRLIKVQWFKVFPSDFFYHTSLIKLAPLGLLRQSNEGDATEDNNRNFGRGYPTELFLIFNQFHRLKRTTKFFRGFPHVAFFLRLVHSRIRVRF